MEKPRRAPAIEKNINQVNESDIRVNLVGTVSEKRENFIILQDSTGNIKIETDQNIELGTQVRVIGRPVKTEHGIELSSEIVKSISNLNQNLYKTLLSLSIKV